MNAPAHSLRQKAAPKPSPEPMHRAASSAASPASAAAATPRYLRASMKLGDVNDPEEHEAEHAASVIASGGCYQLVDPGGSTHLRAASAIEEPAHKPVRKMGADGAAHEPVRKAHADGAAHEPVRKAAAEGAVHEPVRKAAAEGAAYEPVRRMATEVVAHGPIRAAVAPPVLDIGASGRVRRAVAPPILDPGASGRIRSAAGPAVAAPSPDAAQMIERARASATRRLPPAVQARLERGFGQRMDNVGLHSGPSARAAARAIGARAYTQGERITLGPGESEHDLHLLAHEATHVVQNRRAAGVFRSLPVDPATRRAPQAEIHKTEVRKAEASKTEIRKTEVPAAEAPKTEIRKTGAVQPQPIRRIFGIDLPGLDTVLDKFADWANVIPFFRLFTIVLGMNPINRARVDPSGANILRAAVELIPGGGLIVRALDTYGIFEKGGAWLEQQVATLGMVGSAIFDALMSFLHSTDLSHLVLHPIDSWDDAKRIFTEPIDRLKAFFKSVAQGFIDLIKDAVLKPLAALASKTPAWDLLCALLGENPITKEPAPQDASAIIGALMKMAGQEEVWQNIQTSGALAKVAAWFGGAKADLIAFVQQIPALFVAALKSFVIEDLLDLPGAIGRVVGMFGDFAAKFIGWVGKSLLKLLEIVIRAVSPGAWAYVQKTGAALKSILMNPMPFVGNLVKAAKLGLQNFADNIGTHLKTGLISWLTGALEGVYIPQALTLGEIGKFVMSVLGLAWTQVRGKIVKALGPTGEKIMSGLEKAADFIVALVTGGPAALWEMIKEKLTELKDTVIEGIKDFVISTIVKAAIPKLVAMFIPGAGFVAALVSIYGTIKSFMEQLGKVAAAVMAFVDSIVAIAEGQIAGAAKKVESALAGVLAIAIGLLAGFLNLGNVTAKVMAVVKKVQTAVDKALDKAIAWIINKAKALFGKLFGGKDLSPAEAQNKLDSGLAAGKAAVAAFAGKRVGGMVLKPLLAAIRLRFGLTSLEPVSRKGVWYVRGTINPENEVATDAKADSPEAAAVLESAKALAATVSAAAANGRKAIETGQAREEKRRAEEAARTDVIALPTKRVGEESGPGLDVATLATTDDSDVLELLEVKAGRTARAVKSRASGRAVPEGVEQIPVASGRGAAAKAASDPSIAAKIVSKQAVLVQSGKLIQNQLSGITENLRSNINKMFAVLKEGVAAGTIDADTIACVQSIVNGQGGTLKFVIDIEKTASMSPDQFAAAKALIQAAFDGLMSDAESNKTKLEIELRRSK
jgi:hypothetical protein